MGGDVGYYKGKRLWDKMQQALTGAGNDITSQRHQPFDDTIVFAQSYYISDGVIWL